MSTPSSPGYFFFLKQGRTNRLSSLVLSFVGPSDYLVILVFSLILVGKCLELFSISLKTEDLTDWDLLDCFSSDLGREVADSSVTGHQEKEFTGFCEECGFSKFACPIEMKMGVIVITVSENQLHQMSHSVRDTK
ncbi:hypothetical protein XELAEV_18025921mg [Xenopus laevis]|uniref:Uncharacterized protein n=1 Tax=Xenopus laevis TaxID=8355 RepID=A0A974D2M1_XENLA|nr:hypothetical protein XELAEV_18025921mg [Xenopus laevis]